MNNNKKIEELTLNEKISLLEGVDSWNMNGIDRLGLPKLFLTDGPHGLRKVRQEEGGFGLADNKKSTAFPTSATVACSWNPDNLYNMGRAIAEECISEGVDVLLAPGVNIKRSPLCGRNFEYYSEDPLLTGILGEAFVNGVQNKGVGCSVKHFAANSNENYRFVGDSVLDERALREIYLKAFERIIKNTKPYTVMCSYNKLNGTYASQNKTLLTEILRNEWGFDGLVMTDWGATCDRVKGVEAGCDLDMPGNVSHNRNEINKAVNNKTLSENDLNQSVTRAINLIEKCKEEKHDTGNIDEHVELSCEIAKDSAVLLKNNGVLPLSGMEKLLVIGELFEKMRYQGAGSSLINPPIVTTPKDAFEKRKIKYAYEKGFRCFYTQRDELLEKAAVEAAKGAGTILFFGGLNDFEESEGFDREHMRLGENQTELMKKLVALGKKIILVIFAGSPVELPFFDDISAVLNMYLPGMQGGEAAAALLFGEVNPSGKLTESWTFRSEDTSCYDDYDKSAVSKYYESIYVGYRFYDKAKTQLQFPFGYGLSYTNFEYTNLAVKESNDEMTVAVDITNTGNCDGSEIVQLYVKNNKSNVFKAEKELRAFCKIFLRKGETKKTILKFEKSELAYWNIATNSWVLENGKYEICVAAAADDIRLSQEMFIADSIVEPSPYSKSVMDDYSNPPNNVPCSFDELIGYKAPEDSPVKPINLESQLRDLNASFWGRLIYSGIIGAIKKDYEKTKQMPDSLERDSLLKNKHFLVKMMPYNSLRSLVMSSSGVFTYNIASGLVEIANGHLIKGIKNILKKEESLE